MSEPSQRDWYVDNGEKVFGPVPFATLLHWSHTGSVNAESLLGPSAEGPWAPAGEREELELVWQVEDSDGDRYCACHILALRDSLRDGDISPDWLLHHLPSGESTTVVKGLCSALLSVEKIQERQLKEAHRSLASLQAQVDDHHLVETQAAAEEDLKADWKSLKDERDACQREVEKWRSLHESETENFKSREGKLQERIEQLQAWQNQSAERIKALERRRDQLEAVLEKSRGVTGTELQKAYEELEGNFTLLTESLDLRTREVEHARKQVKECEASLSRERAAMQNQLESERETASAALRQLHLMEQTHTDLLRSHRDVHERLIQLRNQAPPRAAINNAPTNATVDSTAQETPELPPAPGKSPKAASRKKRGKISLN